MQPKDNLKFIDAFFLILIESFERECNRLNNKRTKKQSKNGQISSQDNENDHLVNVSSLSSSDSSISSLNGGNLEPLVIQEDSDSLVTTNYIQQTVKMREYNTNVINEKIYEETEEEIAEMMENENLMIAQNKITSWFDFNVTT